MSDITIGILCALVAMVAWGVGDFFIQRSTRTLGDWETLFLITLVGTIILAPFTLMDTLAIVSSGGPLFWILVVASVVLFVASLLDFEALKRGKITVVEPIWSLEIPTGAILAFLFLGEKLSVVQVSLIGALLLGLVFISVKETHKLHKIFVERGAGLALLSALVMGSANFFVGWGARETDPLVVNFFISFVLVVISAIYLWKKNSFGKLWSDVKMYPRMVASMTVLDNVAWVAFAFALSYAPIGIAVALSETYIVISVLLGMYFNKEKLERHQKFGLFVAIVAAILLASVT